MWFPRQGNCGVVGRDSVKIMAGVPECPHFLEFANQQGPILDRIQAEFGKISGGKWGLENLLERDLTA